jgi:hypothetical protein
MPIPFVSEYKKGNYVFPEDNIPFDKKDEKWHLQYANAIMADYSNGRCGISYGDRDRIIENRAWADGTNSEDTFKDIILDYQRDEGERKAYSAIDYTMIPLIAKFKSVFIGILSAIDHRATANSIDPISLRKKTKEKMKLWIKANFPEELGAIDSMLGVKPPKDEYIPQSKAELDMYDQFGGFKLSIETALEAGMKHCFDTSRWNEEIRPQILSDIFDNKICACRDYFDVHTYTIKQEYVDIANAIVAASNSPTFNTAGYAGFMKFVTIADLRVMTAGQDGWGEEELQKIAKKFSNINGNNPSINWAMVPVGNEYGPFTQGGVSKSYEWDPYLIPIAVLEGQSTMYEYDVERTDAGGNVSTYKTNKDRKYDRTDRKSITTPIKVWHKMSLVIGCNKVFDFGLQHDIPRPTYEDARSSFHFYRMKGKSYCERAIPHAKQIQLMYLKVQGLALKAIPPGVAFEYNALKGMMLGDKTLKPWDILKIYGQTGNLGWMGTNIRGHRNETSGVPPIVELKGSYTLADLLAVVEHHKSEMREITGINDMGGRGEQTATGAKLSFMTTDIALKESYNAYLALVKDTAINSAARLRDLLAYSEKAREIYGPIIGITNMEMLDMVSDLPTAHIAVMIEIEATDEDIQFIMEAATKAMAPGKNGEPMFTVADLMLVHRMAKRGMLSFAQAYIADKESKAKKLETEREKQNQEMNGKIALDQENAKSQNELAKSKEENAGKLSLEQEKGKIKLDQMAKQHDYNMAELALQLQIKANEKQLSTAE